MALSRRFEAIAIILSMIALILVQTGDGSAKGIDSRTRPIRIGHIVGLGGTLLISTNGGESWRVQSTSLDNPLTSVEFVNNNTGFATGLNNQILVSVDGGKKWNRETPIYTRPFYDCTPADSDMDRSTSRRILPLPPLHSSDYGQIWSGLTAHSDTVLFCSYEGVSINYFDCTWLDTNSAVIVGGSKTHSNKPGVEESIILQTTNQGKQWISRSPGGTVPLFCVAAGSSKRVVAVGDSGVIVISRDGGNVWKRIAAGTYNRLNGVDYFDSLTYVAVGFSGMIIRSIDGGETWTESSSSASSNLRHVVFSPNGYGIAVGDKGTILRSLDGGRRWVTKKSGTRSNLLAVDFFNDRVAIAIGENGTMLRSVDSGEHWDTMDSFTTEPLARISFVLEESR